MSDDDIDFDRVVADPDYRRRVIEFLSLAAEAETEMARAERRPAQPRDPSAR